MIARKRRAPVFKYTYGEPQANGTRLVRARLTEDSLEDVRVLFSSTLKSSNGNNRGRLAFLHNGTLVLTVGDGSVCREEAPSQTIWAKRFASTEADKYRTTILSFGTQARPLRFTALDTGTPKVLPLIRQRVNC